MLNNTENNIDEYALVQIQMLCDNPSAEYELSVANYRSFGKMNYYISDLHLFHENAIKFDERPFNCCQDMHDAIRASWNNKITNGDKVYILGDISYRGKNEDLIAFISTLKGHKILIKGNHDDVSDYRYHQLFEEVCDYKEIHDSANGTNYELVLSHYPIFSWKKMGYGTILLYGHTHNSAEDEFYQKCLAEMMVNECRHVYSKKPTAINVGCMKPWINYEPRTLKEIIERVFNTCLFMPSIYKPSHE